MYRAAVRPLLEKRCVRCHGGEKIKGEFDLTTRETLLAGGESGAAIDLKRPSESLVLALLRREEKPHMPPKGDPVDQETIGKLAVWIALGAPYDEAKPLANAP